MVNQEIEQTVDFAHSRGWEVVLMLSEEVNARNAEKGQQTRCADGRHPNHHLGPAWFGGIDGFAALEEGDLCERYTLAARKIEKSGYVPGNHDDCAFRRHWEAGNLAHSLHLPDLSAFEARLMHMLLDIKSCVLGDEHRERGFLLNFEHGSTVPPEGRFLTADVWYLKMLHYKLENILRFGLPVAEMILPQNHRKLIIV